MLAPCDIAKLRANQRFLVSELQRRGIEVSVFDWRNEVLEARYRGHAELFQDIDSSIVPYVSAIIAGSKSLTKQLLKRAGISVPNGERFTSKEVEMAVACAEERIGFPVVAKPSVGVQGMDVHTGIDCATELEFAIRSIEESRGECEILIEEHINAKEYRLFVTRAGRYAALHRDPAYVVGDGVRTIRQIAEEESTRRLNPRSNCLGAIVLDQEASRYLRKRGLSFSSVPAYGQKVHVRGSSNVMMGGVPEDVTDLIHPGFVSIGMRALLAINDLPYAGLDIMTADISRAPTPENYRVLEVNSVPGIGIHLAPGKGKSRNVAEMIVDLVFPESIHTVEPIRRAA